MGGGGGGGGGGELVTEGQNPNNDIARAKRVTLMKFKGLLTYHKPHVTDCIAFIMFNTQTACIATLFEIYAIVYSVV